MTDSVGVRMMFFRMPALLFLLTACVGLIFKEGLAGKPALIKRPIYRRLMGVLGNIFKKNRKHASCQTGCK